MEYQKIINLLDNITNQPSKFRTRNCFEINHESRGKYDSNIIRFNTSVIRSELCDYRDSYVLVSGTITITRAGDDAAARTADKRNKRVIFKNCAPFTNV